MADQNIFTRAVHAGADRPSPESHPSATPIHPAVTYTYSDPTELSGVLQGQREGYAYARYGSPTIAALEEALATLEGAEAALALSSGMAALHIVFEQSGVSSGARLLAARDLYGITHTLLQQVLPDDSTLRYVDVSDLKAVQAAIDQFKPQVIFFELMSNPLLKIANLPMIAAAAHRIGATVIVDNTFATPFLVQPLARGADIVIHSATKYLGGHADVMAGVIASDATRAVELRRLLSLYGSNLGPFEAWLLLRSLKTLPLRMREHCTNAIQVARWLVDHPRVSNVWYPGLPDHPQHDLAKLLFRDGYFGGMVAFELRDAGEADVYRVMQTLKLCQTAPSLGDVSTSVLYPVQSSHRNLSREECIALGISDGVLRLSVGIEDVRDIIADLGQALSV